MLFTGLIFELSVSNPKLWDLLDEWIVNPAYSKVNMEHDSYQSPNVQVQSVS